MEKDNRTPKATWCSVEQIAMVAHQANKTYCETLGDGSQPDWQNAPDWQRESVIKGVQFHLRHHLDGVSPSPSNAWLGQKRPNQLPVEQRTKDYLFAAIVAAFFRAECEG